MKQIPVTFNWKLDQVIGMAEVDEKTGNVVITLPVELETNARLRNMIFGNTLRSFSVGIELDGRNVREDEIRYIREKLGIINPIVGLPPLVLKEPT
jgi:hypothetical protein